MTLTKKEIIDRIVECCTNDYVYLLKRDIIESKLEDDGILNKILQNQEDAEKCHKEHDGKFLVSGTEYREFGEDADIVERLKKRIEVMVTKMKKEGTICGADDYLLTELQKILEENE